MTKRIYGQWGGNKKGIPEDTTRCIKAVANGALVFQCQRKRGHGPDGLHCKQHGQLEEERKQRLEREARRP